MLLKLDFAKALDSLDWTFLNDLLLVRGFSEKRIGWLMALFKTSNCSILVNGILDNKIKSKRGLRQDDHLLPLLFNLAVDVFANIINLANSNDILGRVGNEVTSYGIFVLRYAYDTMLLVSSLPHHNFELLLGLKINFDKSSILVLKNIGTAESQVATTLNCNAMNFHKLLRALNKTNQT